MPSMTLGVSYFGKNMNLEAFVEKGKEVFTNKSFPTNQALSVTNMAYSCYQ